MLLEDLVPELLDADVVYNIKVLKAYLKTKEKSVHPALELKIDSRIYVELVNSPNWHLYKQP